MSNNKRSFIEAFAKAKQSQTATNVTTPSEMLAEVGTSSEEDDSTEFKLAILQSMHSDHTSSELLELLMSCNGFVEQVSSLLAQGSPRKRQAASSVGMQSALSSYFSSPSTQRKPPIPYPPPPVPKGKTVHISNPELVPYYSPCTLQAPFLPPLLSNTLLQELLEQCDSFPRQEFRLFDRNVTSPHTSCLFVGGQKEARREKAEYLYNGSYLTDVRAFTPTMTEVARIVESTVNAEVEKRVKEVYPGGKKLKYQLGQGDWKATHAFVNLYDGPKESVGWHSDHLTYTGPRCIIASLSLGVEREFRLRRVALRSDDELLEPGQEKAEKEDKLLDGKDVILMSKSQWSESEGPVSIHLPHNSLLIMHAETQECYKHTLHPASAITPHPIAGGKRINITYRYYRESLRPIYTPRCSCKLPCVLRTVQRKEENLGKYFWMCHAGNAPDRDNCTFFQWAEFDDNGEPIWAKDENKDKTTVIDESDK